MKTYVAGFMFGCVNGHALEVALVRKQKGGQFQVGKLNGIGGKIDGDETPMNAMIREFAEETGSETNSRDWREYCVLGGTDWRVHFFVCLTGAGKVLQTIEEEQIGWHSLNKDDFYLGCVPNLSWLIPLALDKDNVFAQVEDLANFT